MEGNEEMTKLKPTGSRRRTAGVIIASTVALTAVGLALDAARLPVFSPAYADAVRVEGPHVASFADVVQAVSPAVVSVRVESQFQPAATREFHFDRRQGGNNDENSIPPFFRNNPFFKDYPFFRNGPRGKNFGDRDGKRSPRRYGMSQGSGFFVSEDGYIVTNHHVVENGDKFTVVLENGDELPAKLVGADARTDLAVLKVEADRKFTYVKFAQDKVRIGDWVVAVGNPFGLGGTVTAGIVSAANREIATNSYDNFIQIDAAVNKGNSGGPAFNLNGEVIGINTAIFSPSGGNVGIAFAIPASIATQVVNDLIHNGQVVRGWLGVQIQPVTNDIAESLGLKEDKGAIVTEPQEDSPAASAGIKSGDVITAVDGTKVANPRELAHKIGDYAPDSKVKITLWRDGKSQDVDVTLGKLDDKRMASLESGDQGNTNPAQTLESLGLQIEPNDQGNGVVVSDVAPDSGADRKGVQPGDVILSVNGEEINNAEDVVAAVRNAESSGRQAALFQIRRSGNATFVAIPFDKKG
jgi:serine protease Do